MEWGDGQAKGTAGKNCASAACLSCDGIGVVTTISRDGELGNRKVEEVRISPDRS